jgi:diguanylate cyclase (GGDEF)-like protein
MKQSIRAIFKNLSLLLIFMSLLSVFATLLILEYNVSFNKIENLKNQKHIISTLTKLKKDDIELALIQFNGKSTQLLNEINKLRKSYEYDFTGNYLFDTSAEYLADLDKLSALTKNFNETAKLYYTDELKKNTTDERFKKRQLDNAFVNINTHIDNIMLKDIKYKETKFHLLEKVAITLVLLVLFVTLWYSKRLTQIYKDILFLYSVDKNKKDYEIFSEEVDAISLRMKRKPVTSENPAMIDPITNINNIKGMINSYAEKKNLKESNFTGVTVFEIDNFSKTNRAFPQEFTQAVLKKIAFTISLHEQATDVIARTEYNQFTVIFSRASKEQLFKDIDIIRQSISEIKFTTPSREKVQITVSGGFMIKTNNASLDDAIRKAKEILAYAQRTGRNKVSQIRDIAEHELNK